MKYLYAVIVLIVGFIAYQSYEENRQKELASIKYMTTTLPALQELFPHVKKTLTCSGGIYRVATYKDTIPKLIPVVITDSDGLKKGEYITCDNNEKQVGTTGKVGNTMVNDKLVFSEAAYTLLDSLKY